MNAPLFQGVTNYNDSTKSYNNTSLNCPAGLGFGRSRFGSYTGFDNHIGIPNTFDPEPGTSMNYLTAGEVPDLHGARLPRPYGPRDHMTQLSGFGRKKKTRSRNSVSFGTTPGTDHWLSNMTSRNMWGQQYANEGILEAAKTLPGPSNLYNNVPRTPIFNPDDFGGVRVQENYPGPNSPLYGFGRKRRGTGKSGFGSSYMGNTGTMMGPNNVGYEPSIPMYHGGGDTVDFATNKLFRNDMISGPTNSLGPYASYGSDNNVIYGVQQDVGTRDAFLTKNISGQNARTQAGFGRKRVTRTSRNKFGQRSLNSYDMLYSPASGTGNPVLYQQVPPYMNTVDTPSGVYMSYGRKGIKKSAKKVPTVKVVTKKPTKSKMLKVQNKKSAKKSPRESSQSPVKPMLTGSKAIKAANKKERPRLTPISTEKSKMKKVPARLSTTFNNVTISLEKSGKVSVKSRR
jgi:hypothetical protein